MSVPRLNAMMMLNLELKLKELGFSESNWGKDPESGHKFYNGRFKYNISLGLQGGYVYVFTYCKPGARYYYRRLGNAEASRKIRLILKGRLREWKRS